MFHFLKIALFQVFASLGHWNTAVMVILALHLGPIWLVCFIITIVMVIIIIGINIIVVIIIMLIIQGVRFLPHKIKRALSSTSTPHLSMVIIIIIIIITVIL